MATRRAVSPSPGWVISKGLFDSENRYYKYLQQLQVECYSTPHLYQPVNLKDAWQPPNDFFFDHHASKRLSVYFATDRPASSDPSRPLAHDTLFLEQPSMDPPSSIEAVPIDVDSASVVLSKPWTADSVIWSDPNLYTPSSLRVVLESVLGHLDELRGNELLETLDVIHFNSSLWILDPDTSPILSPHPVDAHRLEESGTATSQWWEWYVAQNVICEMRRGTAERARAEELFDGWRGSAWDLFEEVQESTGSSAMLEVLVHCPEPIWESEPDEFEAPS